MSLQFRIKLFQHLINSSIQMLQSILAEIKIGLDFPEKLKIRDPENVEKKLERLVEGGPDCLQVITDFDHTLTKFKTPDGLRCDTCHGIVDNSSLVEEEFRRKTNALRDKYYPIEVDHEMTLQQKIPLMIEWYTQSQNVLVEYRVTKSQIKEMVLKSRAFLRDGAKEVLSMLNMHRIPVLIFSAGVGNILESVLEREQVHFPNIKVVSNYMDFDECDRVTSFQKPLIHMFNKNENALRHSTYFAELQSRRNALLLGDSLGDVHMDHGMPSSHKEEGVVLKIGFLNDKISERCPEFMENFDIVLEDDQSFKLMQLILSRIIKDAKQ
ncbi:cytosolic 5'-nucleotidase 3 [Folsomia candida]|uniref:5'-nucleotidase n=1 Tax=Folsomia candida TaxID=158441 RepID=A0A226F6I9_FOLCA|nr:cytosolic 5'-nucleotidase 3 [Folsomia candida]OXA65068.1 Cytosolic 5'-nucleotidase 3 [Folsomia candida]